MEYNNPIDNINFNDFILVARDSWPKGYKREIEDLDVIKEFYNKSYKEFEKRIIEVLDRYHPATWIRIAYIQLESWTYDYFKANFEGKSFYDIPYLFIPLARYGWRYIIELSLEKNYTNIKEYSNTIPNQKDIDLIFTYILGLTYSSELSNYLHIFEKRFNEIKLTFSPTVYTKFPTISSDTSQFINELIKYTDSKYIDKDFDYFNNQFILEKINVFLENELGFNLKDIDNLAECLRDEIIPSIGASILIISYSELLKILNERININDNKIKNIVDFILLDPATSNYEKRDFLRRSQSLRMLNFAGCHFSLERKNLKTVYSETASKFDYIYNQKSHVIISPILLTEWSEDFKSRLIYGLRTDLKNSSENLNHAISKLEHDFNRNFFEKIILNFFKNLKIPCKSVEKIDRKKISCGEIDVIAIDEKNKIIYIIEAKNLAPAKDIKAYRQVVNDHYERKKYHKKFMNKVDWVKENKEALLFDFNIKTDDDFIIEPYFVTANPSILKFIENSYPILTYSEFKTKLSIYYGKEY